MMPWMTFCLFPLSLFLPLYLMYSFNFFLPATLLVQAIPILNCLVLPAALRAAEVGDLVQGIHKKLHIFSDRAFKWSKGISKFLTEKQFLLRRVSGLQNMNCLPLRCYTPYRTIWQSLTAVRKVHFDLQKL